jgi:hypothetical protein
MESGRLYFDSSSCRGNNNNMNMLFLGNADLGFRGDFLFFLFNLLNFYGTLLFGLNELLFGLFCEK